MPKCREFYIAICMHPIEALLKINRYLDFILWFEMDFVFINLFIGMSEIDPVEKFWYFSVYKYCIRFCCCCCFKILLFDYNFLFLNIFSLVSSSYCSFFLFFFRLGCWKFVFRCNFYWGSWFFLLLFFQISSCQNKVFSDFRLVETTIPHCFLFLLKFSFWCFQAYLHLHSTFYILHLSIWSLDILPIVGWSITDSSTCVGFTI